MRKTNRSLPKTIEAARTELDRLDRRMRADKARVEALMVRIQEVHQSKGKIPAVGSRWVRTMDLGLRSRVLSRSEYEMVAYAHPELGSPVLVFRGEGDRGPYHSVVSLATFYREFDPAPAKRKRKAAW